MREGAEGSRGARGGKEARGQLFPCRAVVGCWWLRIARSRQVAICGFYKVLGQSRVAAAAAVWCLPAVGAAVPHVVPAGAALPMPGAVLPPLALCA